LNWSSSKAAGGLARPRLIAADEHGIAVERISAEAVSVVERLQQAGFKAYIVGGSIRDLLVNQRPKDFDVATSATPEQVRATLPRARLIGRRFRLAHVRQGREIIEVATFRGGHDDSAEREIEVGGRVLRDNVFGSEAEDAERRDFTVNALMYDPSSNTIRDHVGGYDDIGQRRLRLIGDPVKRYREDPVRLLRAIRFMVKLDLRLDEASAAPIRELAPLLASIPSSRLFDELIKLFLGGQAEATYQALVRHGLWQELFPGLFDDPSSPPILVCQTLANTDQRVRDGLPVTPGFLFAAFFWPRVSARSEQLLEQGLAAVDALAEAGEQAIAGFIERVAIPRRFSAMAKEIWMLQPRFERRAGKRAMRLLHERRFRAGYDFLCLRVLERPELESLAKWWTEFQEVDAETRMEMIRSVTGGRTGRARRRPRKRKPSP